MKHRNGKYIKIPELQVPSTQAGRAGRTRPGKCFRLYTLEAGCRLAKPLWLFVDVGISSSSVSATLSCKHIWEIDRDWSLRPTNSFLSFSQFSFQRSSFGWSVAPCLRPSKKSCPKAPTPRSSAATWAQWCGSHAMGWGVLAWCVMVLQNYLI